jgi:nucleotide-binding universal stress UspA family protein
MIAFRHILAPVDFEPCSKQALEVAVDLALRFDSRLTLVHAWDVPGYIFSSPYVSPDVWDLIGKAEVIAAVEKLKADLVVMGTHGRKGLSRVFLGSVAEKIVRGCPVPVLTVRGGGEPATTG